MTISTVRKLRHRCGTSTETLEKGFELKPQALRTSPLVFASWSSPAHTFLDQLDCCDSCYDFFPEIFYNKFWDQVKVGVNPLEVTGSMRGGPSVKPPGRWVQAKSGALVLGVGGTMH